MYRVVRRIGIVRFRITGSKRFCTNSKPVVVEPNNNQQQQQQEKSNGLTHYDSYRDLKNLDFMKAAKILFQTPSQKKKFGKSLMHGMRNLFGVLVKHQSIKICTVTTHIRRLSTRGGDEWNDAWETAWLPDDLSAKNRAPWETDVNFSIASDALDADTKAFVEDMSDNWEQRRRKSKREEEEERLMKLKEEGKSIYSLENVKRDYRVTKQRLHAGLWVKEIEKMEEAKLADPVDDDDDLGRFLDTASQIFESGSSDLNKSKLGDMKNKPDGWETTVKGEDGNLWEMSQREEDVLVQEYERRIAFSKFQIASFIKQHIFSRRRPIDGWKYMIEELGPNARRGSKGSVTRLPSLADPATQPFIEDKIPISTTNTSPKTRGR